MTSSDWKGCQPDDSNRNRQLIIAGLVTIAVMLAAVLSASPWQQTPVRHVATALELEAALSDAGLPALEHIGENSVTRVELASIGSTFRTVRNVERRKSLFLRSMLPVVLMANEEIAADRARLMRLATLYENGRNLSRDEQAWLEETARRYRVDDATDFIALLARVDIVPVSLALGQAAYESGWGTSRFARLGNALFGQWRWGGGGIVPQDRQSGKTHAIADFDTPLDATRAYMLNLNRHRAYADLRRMRAEARAEGRQPEGTTLAAGLVSYSERGQAYVKTLRQIIRQNGLAALDGIALADDGRSLLIRPSGKLQRDSGT